MEHPHTDLVNPFNRSTIARDQMETRGRGASVMRP